jgi:pimeloyl-ACP methyl ester carboxylesterase
MARFDSRGWISLVDVPTAVVITTRDELVPVRGQRELADYIPGAHVVEVPLDHDAPAAAPGIFVPALRGAVEHVLRTARRPATQREVPERSRASSG